MQERKRTVLNLFPESLAIVDWFQKEFHYYNEAFDRVFNVSRFQKLNDLNNYLQNEESDMEKLSVKITYHSDDHSKR